MLSYTGGELVLLLVLDLNLPIVAFYSIQMTEEGKMERIKFCIVLCCRFVSNRKLHNQSILKVLSYLLCIICAKIRKLIQGRFLRLGKITF